MRWNSLFPLYSCRSTRMDSFTWGVCISENQNSIGQYTPFNTFSRRMSGSSGPVMEQPFSLAYWMYRTISGVIRSPGARMGMPGG